MPRVSVDKFRFEEICTWAHKGLTSPSGYDAYGSERALEIIAQCDPQPLGWQPIETAPERHDELLLYCRGWRPVIGYYSEIVGGYVRVSGPTMRFTPTHWMPLPDAPEGDV